MVTTFSSSDFKVGPQVFINFRGAELRKSFISVLHKKLKCAGINAFIDSDEAPGQELKNLFAKIEESKIALAVLSSRYTESHWCLQELVKMMECSSMRGEGCNNNKLLVIPILYKLKISTVADLDGDFGLNLWNLWRLPGHNRDRDSRIIKWNEALKDVLSKKALIFADDGSKEAEFVSTIVRHVQNALTLILTPREQNPNPKIEAGGNPKPQYSQIRASNNTEPNEQRLKQLESKLKLECNDDQTRIVGVVGMPGIGKTHLVEELFVKLERKITHCVFIRFERGNSDKQGREWLQQRLLEGLSDPDPISAGENGFAGFKIGVVLDNVVARQQVDEFLRSCDSDSIKKGSKIVVTTRDKSAIEGLVSDLYEIPGLNERGGLELLRAQICSSKLEGKFLEMSRKFVDFTGGNPLALMAFGKELKGKEEAQWEARLRTMTQESNPKVKKVLRDVYDNDLNQEQRDAFLDIVCFFRSQDENYVTRLLDDSAGVGRQVKDLVDKFLIRISDGRIEMHNLLFTMGRELLLDASTTKYWMLSSNSSLSYDVLKYRKERDSVRGVVVDMSKMEEMSLNNKVFFDMSSLRYLKVYNSLYPTHSENACKLNLPDGLQFPKDNTLRYLYWVKFPGKELPSDFEPKNLIDLCLPYSQISCVWECVKDAPNLKWVDLRNSINLTSLTGLLQAPNLLKLNLEGCTSLTKLPEEMEKMKSLILLNLRGCSSLLSLPKITMDSLKTLILTGCSKFHTFDVISKQLENLYLNGTAITGLPPTIGNLHRLILLNLKDCRNLATLPNCLGELKSLQELKLSRCFELKSFSTDDGNNMVKLRVLLLDETSIAEMPSNVIYLSMLRRLCLSGNNAICSIQFDMGQLSHLKWLELMHCQNLTSLSRLPPNLQCLNAHGCTSLRTVASPLALLIPTEHIHSTFIFTNCHELEQVSKNAILSYVQKKSQLMSDDRHSQGFVFKPLIGTCFPGCEIPAWFNYQASGSVLTLELPRDWNAGRIIGIALCSVIVFKEYKGQNKSLQVKCTCKFTNASLSAKSFIMGGWSEPGKGPCTFENDHVFVGYTSICNIRKCQELIAATEVSLKFEVTNGVSEVVECSVLKCGFTLVYESDAAENTSWETPDILDQRSSFKTNGDGPSTSTSTTPTYSKMFNIFGRKAQ